MAKNDIMDILTKWLGLSLVLHGTLYLTSQIVVMFGNWITNAIGVAPFALSWELLAIPNLLTVLLSGLVLYILLSFKPVREMVL